jgi:hypothetical protein
MTNHTAGCDIAGASKSEIVRIRAAPRCCTSALCDKGLVDLMHRQEAEGYVLRFHFWLKSSQDLAQHGFGALQLFDGDRESGILGNRMHP